MKRERKPNELALKVLSEITPLQSKQIENRMYIACRLYDLMQAKGYNIQILADKIQIKEDTLSTWLSGWFNLNIQQITHICFALDVELKSIYCSKSN